MTLEATRLVAAAPNDKESEPGQAKEIGNGQEQADNRVVNTHRNSAQGEIGLASNKIDVPLRRASAKDVLQNTQG